MEEYYSLIENGEEVCVNCAHWLVSPYGSSYGMYCRRGNGETDPDDTCFEFEKAYSFANYGDSGQFQFDESKRESENKLFCWGNSRY